MEEAPSTKKSKTEETRQNTREAGKTRVANWAHGPCTQEPTRSAIQRYGTAVPSGTARFVRSRFFAFLNAFSLHFSGPLLDLLESTFRVELGFILSLNKPH